ncbi:MAG: hypothetical protein OEZ36_12680 [Spirochaetota bacterium]|nr:hypothetical protein [Spirochaetota bacterium]
MGFFFEDDDDNKVKIDKKDEKQILKLAKAKYGRLTVSEVALGTSLSLEEADAALKQFVIGGYANMEVTDEGAIVYDFPGIKHTTSHTKTDSGFSQGLHPPMAQPGSRRPAKQVNAYIPTEQEDNSPPKEEYIPEELPPMAKPVGGTKHEPIKPYTPKETVLDDNSGHERDNATAQGDNSPPEELPPMAKPGSRSSYKPVKPYLPAEAESDGSPVDEDSLIQEDSSADSGSDVKSAETPDWLKNRRKKNWEG